MFDGLSADPKMPASLEIKSQIDALNDILRDEPVEQLMHTLHELLFNWKASNNQNDSAHLTARSGMLSNDGCPGCSWQSEGLAVAHSIIGLVYESPNETNGNNNQNSFKRTTKGAVGEVCSNLVMSTSHTGPRTEHTDTRMSEHLVTETVVSTFCANPQILDTEEELLLPIKPNMNAWTANGQPASARVTHNPQVEVQDPAAAAAAARCNLGMSDSTLTDAGSSHHVVQQQMVGGALGVISESSPDVRDISHHGSNTPLLHTSLSAGGLAALHTPIKLSISGENLNDADCQPQLHHANTCSSDWKEFASSYHNPYPSTSNISATTGDGKQETPTPGHPALLPEFSRDSKTKHVDERRYHLRKYVSQPNLVHRLTASHAVQHLNPFDPEVPEHRLQGAWKWFGIHPEGNFRIRWDMFSAMLLIYILITLPYRVAFDSIDSSQDWVHVWENIMIPILFAIDIVLNFSTGVYIQPGGGRVDDEDDRNLVVRIASSHNFHDNLSTFGKTRALSFKPMEIACRYTKGWLLIDVLSTIPWGWLLQPVVGASAFLARSSRMLKLLRLFRLLRLLRIIKLMSVILNNIDKVLPRESTMLMGIFLLVLVMSHLISCGWIFIAYLENDYGTGTWLESYFGDELVKTTDLAIYSTGIYWSAVTLSSVGYGDVLPVTEAEQMYSILIMALGVAVIAVTTSQLTTIYSNFGTAEYYIRSELERISRYCKHRDIPPEIYSQMLMYTKVWATQRARYNEELILNQLSPGIKSQVLCHLFKDTIQNVPFFKGCDDMFLAAVLCVMNPVLFAPRDIIIQKGQEERSMYLLCQGKAGLLSNKGEIEVTFAKGAYFGEIALFFKVPRTATICAISFCDIFKLRNEPFEVVMKEYPLMKERVVKAADAMFTERVVCIKCGRKGHTAANCIYCETKNVDPHHGY